MTPRGITCAKFLYFFAGKTSARRRFAVGEFPRRRVLRFQFLIGFCRSPVLVAVEYFPSRERGGQLTGEPTHTDVLEEHGRVYERSPLNSVPPTPMQIIFLLS